MDTETHPLDYHDTPRVNAFLRNDHVAADAMWAEFAATLERDNAKLRTDLESTRRDLEYAAAKLEKAGLLND